MKSILAGIAQPTPLVRAGALGDRVVLKRVHRSHPNFKTINQIGKSKFFLFISRCVTLVYGSRDP